LLIGPAISGDTDLDGSVGFSDLVRLAQHYGIKDGTATWFEGDVNYDGNVGFADLVAVAQHYGQGPASAIAGASAAFNADLAEAFAEVPEPGTMTLSLVGMVVCALGRGMVATSKE
jgi:hypothetical protein